MYYIHILLFHCKLQAEYDLLDQKFQHFVIKQEQTLRVSIYLLLNLSEDLKVIFVIKQEQTLRVSIYLLLNLSEDLKVVLELVLL